MKPAPFEYHRPTSLQEALGLLADAGPDARPLAGGQSLIPAMNFRLAQPAVLIDLNRIEELSLLERTADGLQLGAMVRQSVAEKSSVVAEAAPLLAETLPWIAHPQIRNRGTIGGSLAHADPAAELPVIATALEARFRARSLDKERWIAAEDFFLGLFSTALAPGELLVSVEIPTPAGRFGSSFTEFARRHGDYALAGAAAVIQLDARARCRICRLVLLNVADTPVSATEAASVLEGETLGRELLTEAAHVAARRIEPIGDVHASPAYRRHLAEVMARRALQTAWQRALDRQANDG